MANSQSYTAHDENELCHMYLDRRVAEVDALKRELDGFGLLDNVASSIVAQSSHKDISEPSSSDRLPLPYTVAVAGKSTDDMRRYEELHQVSVFSPLDSYSSSSAPYSIEVDQDGQKMYASLFGTTV